MQFGVSSRGMQKAFPQCECEYVAVDPPCPWHGNHNGCIHGVARLPSPAIAEPTGTEPGSLGIQLLFTFLYRYYEEANQQFPVVSKPTCKGCLDH